MEKLQISKSLNEAQFRLRVFSAWIHFVAQKNGRCVEEFKGLVLDISNLLSSLRPIHSKVISGREIYFNESELSWTRFLESLKELRRGCNTCQQSFSQDEEVIENSHYGARQLKNLRGDFGKVTSSAIIILDWLSKLNPTGLPKSRREKLQEELDRDAFEALLFFNYEKSRTTSLQKDPQNQTANETRPGGSSPSIHSIRFENPDIGSFQRMNPNPSDLSRINDEGKFESNLEGLIPMRRPDVSPTQGRMSPDEKPPGFGSLVLQPIDLRPLGQGMNEQAKPLDNVSDLKSEDLENTENEELGKDKSLTGGFQKQVASSEILTAIATAIEDTDGLLQDLKPITRPRPNYKNYKSFLQLKRQLNGLRKELRDLAEYASQVNPYNIRLYRKMNESLLKPVQVYSENAHGTRVWLLHGHSHREYDKSAQKTLLGIGIDNLLDAIYEINEKREKSRLATKTQEELKSLASYSSQEELNLHAHKTNTIRVEYVSEEISQPSVEERGLPKYQYTPLVQDEIRVLILCQGKEGDILEGEIETVTLASATHSLASVKIYEVLWHAGVRGPPEKQIQISGHQVGISLNLWEALVQLRNERNAAALWVDEICIALNDDEEKQLQTSRIKDIYTQASRTIVWLGHDTQNPFGFLLRIMGIKFIDDLIFDDNFIAECTEFFSLLGQSWLNQSSLLQGVVQAKQCVARYGRYSMGWLEFMDAVALLITIIDRLKSSKSSHSLEDITNIQNYAIFKEFLIKTGKLADSTHEKSTHNLEKAIESSLDESETATAFSRDSGYGSMASKTTSSATKNSEKWETGSIVSLATQVTGISSIDPTGADGAAVEFAEILMDNEEVRENVKTGFTVMGAERFERNFNRLLKQYAADLRKDAPDNLQKSAIQVVHNYRAYVTRVLRSRIMGPADHEPQAVAFHIIKDQGASRLMLERLLSEPALLEGFDQANPHPQDNREESDDESQSDNDEPYLTNLERMRNFLVSSAAFERFKIGLRDFVTANPQANYKQEEHVIEDENSCKTKLVIDNYGILKRFKSAVRKMFRPSVRPGSKRVEWICDCGNVLYADFDANSVETIHLIESLFKKPKVISCSGPEHENQSSNGSQTLPPPNNGVLNTSTEFSSIIHTNQQKYETAPKVKVEPSVAINTPNENLIFFELCVNAGQFMKILGEIDVSAVITDGDFFAVVKEHYLRLRSFRARFWLLKPTNVSYVRFSVEDRCRVGILHKPVALPPKSEVTAKRYTYEPCPLENELPIDPELFIHYLFHCSTPSKRKAWLPRIPRKLDKSIFAATDPAGFGWGIHIDEGPDYLRIFLLNVGILSVSGILALVWTIVKHDFQGAFGFACWIVALLNSVMAVFIAKWKQE